MATSTDPGLFNFQKVMDDFYKMDPGKEDSEARAYKVSTAANMVSKGFDAQMAESMAQTQAALSKDMMTQQADLAMRNEGQARKEEFQYGMDSMGAQVDFQNKYQDAQQSRDLGMLAATGEQDRKNIQKTGEENRLGQITGGEQERQNETTRGEQERLNESNRGKEARTTMEKGDELTARKKGRENARARSLARAF